ncbi:MAG: hypothetical protein ACLR23_06175 [Clostridia bacterium]
MTAIWICDTMGIKNSMGEREEDGQPNIAKNQRKGLAYPLRRFPKC